MPILRGEEPIVAKREQTILSALTDLEELLQQLNVSVDFLTERNPLTAKESPQIMEQRNVFDGIIDRLETCKGLTKKAILHIQIGISDKVQ